MRFCAKAEKVKIGMQCKIISCLYWLCCILH